MIPLLYHDWAGHSRKSMRIPAAAWKVRKSTAFMRVFTPKITTGKCMQFPFWNEFFTFSTGFSTVFVKKKCSFPRCFPLFPPGFPHPAVQNAIPSVIAAATFWKVLGEIVGISPFIKKKVEGFSFHFTVYSGLQVCTSPNWNLFASSFPHISGHKTAVWKSCGKRWFSTTKIACIPKQSVLESNHTKRDCRTECCAAVPFVYGVTSYCGTPAVRSGSTGSSCRHPRWW